jgi:hypothetical protein
VAFGQRAGGTRRPASFFRRLRKALAEIFYGMTGYEFEREAAHIRADLENLFLFLVAGDLVGVPILPPYYGLRLLPFLLEDIPYWRRRLLRERNPFENEEFDLHGL